MVAPTTSTRPAPFCRARRHDSALRRDAARRSLITPEAACQAASIRRSYPRSLTPALEGSGAGPAPGAGRPGHYLRSATGSLHRPVLHDPQGALDRGAGAACSNAGGTARWFPMFWVAARRPRLRRGESRRRGSPPTATWSTALPAAPAGGRAPHPDVPRAARPGAGRRAGEARGRPPDERVPGHRRSSGSNGTTGPRADGCGSLRRRARRAARAAGIVCFDSSHPPSNERPRRSSCARSSTRPSSTTDLDRRLRRSSVRERGPRASPSATAPPSSCSRPSQGRDRLVASDGVRHPAELGSGSRWTTLAPHRGERADPALAERPAAPRRRERAPADGRVCRRPGRAALPRAHSARLRAPGSTSPAGTPTLVGRAGRAAEWTVSSRSSG